MAPCLDCYVMLGNRNAELPSQFLDAFLPDRQPITEPQITLSDGATLDFQNHLEVFEHFSQHPEVDGAYYFTPLLKGHQPEAAIIAYTCDAGLVLGISVDEGIEEAVALQWLRRLMEWAKADEGFIGCEEPPPASGEEFRLAAAKAWRREPR